MRMTEEKENVLYIRTFGGFSVRWNGKLIAGGSKANNSQATNLLQILLLNRAQSLGGSCVTAEDNEVTPHLKEPDDGLTGKLIDDVERTRSIRCTGIIAQIQVIVLGKQLADAVKNGKSAVATVKDADRAWVSG